MLKFGVLCAIVLMVAGCSDDAGGGNRWSCDVGTGGGRVCVDNEVPAAAAQFIDMAKAQCTMAPSNGTVGTTCDTTGSVGGCRLTSAGGVAGNNTTQWFFSGTMAEVMANCQPGAVYVAAP